FFDLGNTLIDETRAHGQRNARLSQILSQERNDVSVADIELAMRQSSEEFAPRLIVRALEILAGRAFPYENLLKQVGYDKSYERPYCGVDTLLRIISQKYMIGIIANQSAGTAERIKSYGLSSFISLCLSSAEEGLSKPDPAMFELALTRAGCSPEDAVMVGDRIDNDIAPARRAGWRTVRVLQGYGQYQKPRTQEETADYTVQSVNFVEKILIE
ncbi:MAG: HAD family hydrolase, partial [Pseudomonadota bacterium]